MLLVSPARRAGYSSGPRLPLGPRREARPGCIRAADTSIAHEDPIAFDLVTYGRKVGRIQLCGPCFRVWAQLAPADPLTVGY